MLRLPGRFASRRPAIEPSERRELQEKAPRRAPLATGAKNLKYLRFQVVIFWNALILYLEGPRGLKMESEVQDARRPAPNFSMGWNNDLEKRRIGHREYMRRRYQTDPEHRAKHLVRVQTKYADKAKVCENCGAEAPEAHHPDYTVPTLRIWLCRDCHLALHSADAGNAGGRRVSETVS